MRVLPLLRVPLPRREQLTVPAALHPHLQNVADMAAGTAMFLVLALAAVAVVTAPPRIARAWRRAARARHGFARIACRPCNGSPGSCTCGRRAP